MYYVQFVGRARPRKNTPSGRIRAAGCGYPICRNRVTACRRPMNGNAHLAVAFEPRREMGTSRRTGRRAQEKRDRHCRRESLPFLSQRTACHPHDSCNVRYILCTVRHSSRISRGAPGCVTAAVWKRALGDKPASGEHRRILSPETRQAFIMQLLEQIVGAASGLAITLGPLSLSQLRTPGYAHSDSPVLEREESCLLVGSRICNALSSRGKKKRLVWGGRRRLAAAMAFSAPVRNLHGRVL